MREFLMKLFATREEPFDITLFSIWHILYFAIIIGSMIGAALYLKGKSSATKQKALRFIAYAIVIVYLGDFFIQPLFRGGYEMNVDKLPFHICTALCPIIAFTQFNSKFRFAQEPIAFLAIVGPLMYLTYPGTAIGGISPFCYEIIQTFLYHGLVLSWGFLNIATAEVKPNIKNCYKSLIVIVLVAIWASFGNAVYSNEDHHYDWFFLTGSTFPFIPEWLMPFVVIFCVFGMVLIIYGLYYLIKYIMKKRKGAYSK